MNLSEEKLIEWYFCVVSIDIDFQKQLGMRFDRIMGLRKSMEEFFEEEGISKPKR